MADYNAIVNNWRGSFTVEMTQKRDQAQEPIVKNKRNMMFFYLSQPFGGTDGISCSAQGASKIFTGHMIDGKKKDDRNMPREIVDSNKTSTQDVVIPALLEKMEYGTTYEISVKKSNDINDGQMFEAQKIDFMNTMNDSIGMKNRPALFVASKGAMDVVYCLMLDNNTASFAVEYISKNEMSWKNANFIMMAAPELANDAIDMIHAIISAEKKLKPSP